MWGCSGVYVEGLAIPKYIPAEGRKELLGGRGRRTWHALWPKTIYKVHSPHVHSWELGFAMDASPLAELEKGSEHRALKVYFLPLVSQKEKKMR